MKVAVDNWGFWSYLFSVPVGLLVLGLVCVVFEVFVPSGGLLGFTAGVFLVAAVAIAFAAYGEGFGVVILLVVALVTPVVVFWGFRVWPETSLGRQMVLWPPSPEELGPNALPAGGGSDLTGKIGRAVTDLRPGGVVKVEDREFSAICPLGVVRQGTPIVVREVRGSYLVVEPANGVGKPDADLVAELPNRPANLSSGQVSGPETP